MKPAPSRKNCHDHAPEGPPGCARSVANTAMPENARIIAMTAA
jgi:hypothetical protein